jgi:hypothetical protein
MNGLLRLTVFGERRATLHAHLRARWVYDTLTQSVAATLTEFAANEHCLAGRRGVSVSSLLRALGRGGSKVASR